jgi:hypothetical protein
MFRVFWVENDETHEYIVKTFSEAVAIIKEHDLENKNMMYWINNI